MATHKYRSLDLRGQGEAFPDSYCKLWEGREFDLREFMSEESVCVLGSVKRESD